MKVSIITVCFNSELTIEHTINSVKSQDYPNIEHIIVDGGSIDSTLNIIESISSHNSVLISEPDLGIYDAMNKGLNKATGDVVALLNSDDYYPRDNIISQIVDFFTSNPSVAIVFGNVYYVKANDLTKPIRHYSSYNFSPWKMRFGFMPAHPAAFIKYSAYEKIGFYSVGYKIASDFEWFVRALLINKLPY